MSQVLLCMPVMASIKVQARLCGGVQELEAKAEAQQIIDERNKVTPALFLLEHNVFRQS